LNFVNSLEPREKWIVPLLEDVPFQDFRAFEIVAYASAACVIFKRAIAADI